MTTQDRDRLLADTRRIMVRPAGRESSMQEIADLLRHRGNFRWVGLYDVDHLAATVNNVVWSGPGAPEFPSFPLSKGLTGSAIANKATVNVGDVRLDPRYLTAFGTTRSEIIVPVLDEAQGSVIGTIDVESEKPQFFDQDTQRSWKLAQPWPGHFGFSARHRMWECCSQG